MTISTEVVIALIPVIAGAIGGLWYALRKAEAECDALREAKAKDDKTQAELLVEQRIANVGALSTIAMREFERDAYKERCERCEREMDRLRDIPVQRQGQ